MFITGDTNPNIVSQLAGSVVRSRQSIGLDVCYHTDYFSIKFSPVTLMQWEALLVLTAKLEAIVIWYDNHIYNIEVQPTWSLLMSLIWKYDNMRIKYGKHFCLLSLNCDWRHHSWITGSVLNFIHTGECITSNINSYPPSAPLMHRWTGSALVRVMSHWFFGAKPSPEPMLYYSIGLLGMNYNAFSLKKMHSKMSAIMAAILSRGRWVNKLLYIVYHHGWITEQFRSTKV